MVNVRYPRCLHDSCSKAARYNIEGSRPAAYCKRHAEDGMVNVCARHSSNTWRTPLGSAHYLPTDGASTSCDRIDVGLSDSPAGNCLKRLRWEFDGKQPAHCLGQAAREAGPVVHTADVDMAGSNGGSGSIPPLASSTHLHDNGSDGGTAARRTRHRLYRRAIPPEEVSIQVEDES